MIRKFIDRLLGKTPPVATAASEPLPAGVTLGQRVEIPAEVHKIDPKLLAEPAVWVVRTLQEAGYEAYIVGGAVRDLLVGLRPKDFDVATDATPEQVKGLFRKAYIVGKRFRLVHVIHRRGREVEQIEVSTFRAYLDASEAAQVGGNEKTSKEELAGKSHAVDASGRVLRDNVWGPQIEDAARRDFTVNAMYYDPATRVVVDYHGGFQDSKARLLRIIGDPELRYREDPVRIIRVLRFAAKMGYAIEPRTEAPIRAMKSLLSAVPASRMFDELIKLLQTGHSLQSLQVLKKYGLTRGVFPILEAHFEGVAGDPARDAFVNRALADTDRRVAENKPVAPSFLLACMFWHEVSSRWRKIREQGEPVSPALQQAIDATFNARIGDISGRSKLGADMREIWMMQPRFEKRTGGGPESMLAQSRFRAAFDFLRLRAESGEVDRELAEWWERFSSTEDPSARQDLMDSVRRSSSQRRPDKAPARGPRPAPSADGGGQTQGRVQGQDQEQGDEPMDMPADVRGQAAGRPESLRQLALTARAALAENADDDDKAAMRALFDKLGLGEAPPPGPTPADRRELVQDFAGATLAALASGASQDQRSLALELLEKVERKAANRRRRGGRSRHRDPAGE